MNERAKANALRTGIVVLGSLAFGYLSFQIGFKSYLEKAQEFDSLQQSSHSPSKSQEE